MSEEEKLIKAIKKEHSFVRRDLWINVACAYVSSSNSADKESAAKWADQILNDFDERFQKGREISKDRLVFVDESNGRISE